MHNVNESSKSGMMIRISALLLMVIVFLKSTKAHSAATAGTALAYVTAWSNVLNPILESCMLLAAILASIATAIFYIYSAWKLRKDS